MAPSPANSHGNGYPLGLAGAVSATRFVGGTATVAPTTGTFAVGDFVIGQNGTMFVCTVAGTPGTWVQVGGGSFQPVGLTAWAAGGWYYGALGGYKTGASTFADGDQCWVPLFVPKATAVDRIGGRILSVGGAGCVVRLGAYSSGADGYPGAVLLDAGTIDGNSGTAQEITIAATLPAGVVWASMKVQGGLGTLATVQIASYKGYTGTETFADAVGDNITGEDSGYYKGGRASGALAVAPALSAMTSICAPNIVFRTA